ncbi:DUF3558 domain-containing protein [Saccharothrix sp. NRRL B-16348]|uniref:DUF3558 domain-containing protein n=1 Tax=Saccharothrix sp. NRRL B-16348 TaxID=1415542 RepID=UPI0006AEF3AC|nr:DUF3558 domain-containing protein [Saccharothrix sp. NRRL B-16348]
MRRSLTGVLVALALTTACSTRTPVEPTSSEPTTTAQSSPSATSQAPRPREIRLETEQPCLLLTAAQRTEFLVEGEGKPLPIKTYETTGCNWTSAHTSYTLVPVTTEGIEAWAGNERAARASVTDPVRDFPAITVTIPSDTASCDVMVDTAAGQYLVASFTAKRDSPDLATPCDGARRLAEAAMRNLAG